jgi:2-polyprenyl-3-methyl-5-hydroxy-6-metoxy-1,4-benzoquinol methylase
MKKSFELELLDQDNIPEQDLYQNLRELQFINTYLGGHAVIKKGLAAFKSKQLNVLEIGSGGGDNLGALQKAFPDNLYTGLDLKKTCINYSHSKYSSITWLCDDYKKIDNKPNFDVIFNSLFCHHFKDEELVEMLKLMYTKANKGFFIGDLHRHNLAYYAIKFLTTLFSKSYLVKNDAPLSVKRGFTKPEWQILLKKAGINNYQIKWCWAFRHLIIAKK